MKLPDYPAPGAAVRATWGRQIVDYLRSIRTLESIDVRPVEGANGTTLRLKSQTIQRSSGAAFPWDKCDLGYSYTDNIFTGLAGEFSFRDNPPYLIAEKELTISADNTYAFIQIEWGTGIASWEADTSKPVTSTTHFRKWLYLIGYNSTANKVTGINRYGFFNQHVMPIFG